MTDTITKPELLETDTPLSSRMGWPLLSGRKPNIELKTGRATMFSDMLGWPLLSHKQATRIDLKSVDATPLSSRLNWPLLSGRGSKTELMTDNPHPFSAMFKLPLLSDQSTLFGAELSTPGGSTGGSSIGRFFNQIMTGEVQK